MKSVLKKLIRRNRSSAIQSSQVEAAVTECQGLASGYSTGEIVPCCPGQSASQSHTSRFSTKAPLSTLRRTDDVAFVTLSCLQTLYPSKLRMRVGSMLV